MNHKYMALVVDDEVLVRNYVSYVLQEYHLDVVQASNVFEAWKIYQEHKSEIALVYLDAWTLLLNGENLFQMLRFDNPEISILYSLSNQEPGSLVISQDKNSYFLNKPFSPALLLDKVAMALKRYSKFENTPSSSAISQSL